MLRTVHAIARRTPFFYGWVVLGCAMCSSFARQAAAVATLSVFVVPMTAEFGWNRAEISGAVSLGGIIAAVTSPMVGRLVDRIGARAVLVWSAVLIASTATALSATHSLLWFYVFFSFGRMLFASPFDIGITAAAANWFVRRRARAMAIITLAAAMSLAIMPLFAQFAIEAGGWRHGWVMVAVAVLLVGAVPNFFLMVRRPEDVGMTPDGDRSSAEGFGVAVERSLTVQQARRTPALWLLMFFTALIFCVQAGISLHQAPVMISHGMDATVAASVVSVFATVAALSGLAFGWLGARIPVRIALAGTAVMMAAGAVLTGEVQTAVDGYLSATVFGLGIGGLLTLVPVAFADYFGRAHYGAIRGMALPAQVVGQAAGPLIAGLLFDASGSYRLAMYVFAAIAVLAAVVAVLARPPIADPRAGVGDGDGNGNGGG